MNENGYCIKTKFKPGDIVYLRFLTLEEAMFKDNSVKIKRILCIEEDTVKYDVGLSFSDGTSVTVDESNLFHTRKESLERFKDIKINQKEAYISERKRKEKEIDEEIKRIDDLIKSETN